MLSGCAAPVSSLVAGAARPTPSAPPAAASSQVVNHAPAGSRQIVLSVDDGFDDAVVAAYTEFARPARLGPGGHVERNARRRRRGQSPVPARPGPRYLQPGTIMLGHANHPTVIGLLDDLLDLIRSRALSPVTLDEMFHITRAGPR